ncbi:hypothetical protein I6F48_00340 [Pseudoalteromonas sp. SWYJ118]|jgi:hypothetical protein|nr:hypothetical protein [Pseudoalteromonas sp. SWYJ118]
MKSTSALMAFIDANKITRTKPKELSFYIKNNKEESLQGGVSGTVYPNSHNPYILLSDVAKGWGVKELIINPNHCDITINKKNKEISIINKKGDKFTLSLND